MWRLQSRCWSGLTDGLRHLTSWPGCSVSNPCRNISANSPCRRAMAQPEDWHPNSSTSYGRGCRRRRKSAAPFRMALNPPGSARKSCAFTARWPIRQVSPGGADAGVGVRLLPKAMPEMARLRAAACARHWGDFAALVGLNRSRAHADVVPGQRPVAAAWSIRPM